MSGLDTISQAVLLAAQGINQATGNLPGSFAEAWGYEYIRNYDGFPDGTDTAPALVAAIAALGGGSGRIGFGGGFYTFNSTVSFTVAQGQTIVIAGQGASATTFHFTSGGISVTLSQSGAVDWILGSAVEFYDFAMATDEAGLSNAITVVGGAITGDATRPVLFRGLVLRGWLSNTYWAVGIALSDVQDVSIISVSYFGSLNDASVGTGMTIAGTTIANISTVYMITDFQLQYAYIGLEIDGYIQGVIVSSSNFTYVTFGIIFNGILNQSTECSIFGTQINILGTNGIGIYFSQVVQGVISGCLIYATADNSIGIVLDDGCLSNAICGNNLSSGGANTIAMVLKAGANLNTITSNNVLETFLFNIVLQALCQLNNVALNIVHLGTPVIDSGTDNTVITQRARVVSVNGPIATELVAVANLIAVGTAGAGARSMVTDATLGIAAGIGTVVVGLGANKVPVYCDGVNWIIG